MTDPQKGTSYSESAPKNALMKKNIYNFLEHY